MIEVESLKMGFLNENLLIPQYDFQGKSVE